MCERWTAERSATLERLWNVEKLPKSEIRRRMNLTPGQLEGRAMRMNLHYTSGRLIQLDLNHPSVAEMRTRHQRRVQHVSKAKRWFILKPGAHQRKLGVEVAKGRWRGMPFYSLTLEERATCPASCPVLAICYGNNMQNAVRYRHGRALEERLVKEIAHLERRHHGRGFVVRLHILGDFYSVAYVELWRRMLDLFPSLNVFGYTAWEASTPIGAAVAALRDEQWTRFAVRTSGGAGDTNTVVIDTAGEKADDAIICPVETGRARSCGKCALCWTTRKTIAFLRH